MTPRLVTEGNRRGYKELTEVLMHRGKIWEDEETRMSWAVYGFPRSITMPPQPKNPLSPSSSKRDASPSACLQAQLPISSPPAITPTTTSVLEFVLSQRVMGPVPPRPSHFSPGSSWFLILLNVCWEPAYHISGVWNSSDIGLDLGKLHNQIQTLEHSRLDFTAAGAANDFFHTFYNFISGKKHSV